VYGSHILNGVIKTLASLATRTDKSESMRMDELCPMQVMALQTANLAQNVFTSLGKILDNQQMDATIDDKEVKKDNQDARTV
jgi:hypothetical protein